MNEKRPRVSQVTDYAMANNPGWKGVALVAVSVVLGFGCLLWAGSMVVEVVTGVATLDHLTDTRRLQIPYAAAIPFIGIVGAIFAAFGVMLAGALIHRLLNSRKPE